MAKTSVDILINAKDNASKQLKDVSQASKGMSSSMAGMAGGLTKMVPLLAAVGAGFLAFKSLKGIISGGIEAFAIQEKAVRDLSTTLDALGDSSKDLMPDLQAYAGELQLLTNVEIGRAHV